MDLSSMAELELALKAALTADEEGARTVVRPMSEGGSRKANMILDGDWKGLFRATAAEHPIEEVTFLREGELGEMVGRMSVGEQLDLFALGVAALQLFMGANWVGMDLEDLDGLSEGRREETERRLAVDGEGVVPVAKHVELLLLARMALCANKANNVYQNSWILQWWALRALVVHQKVLEEKSQLLHKEATLLISSLSGHLGWEDPLPESPVLAKTRALWLLEAANFHSAYFEVSQALALVEEAAQVAGISVALTGAMGKRTRFQARDLAQLTIDVKSLGTERTRHDDDEDLLLERLQDDLPTDIKLEDEVRLEKIRFAKEVPAISKLNLVEQGIMMAEFTLRQGSRPRDELTLEELSPYLGTILDSRSCWGFREAALLFRSRLEADNRRSVERSMMQVQALVDSIHEERADKSGRMVHLHSSCLPPWWEVERSLCKLLQSMGSTKAALDIALRLKAWEDVIHCYHQLQLRHKAAEVIREEIAKKGETPLLLCMLGDATDEIDNYHKAVEVSGGKSARAFRSLGVYYYFRQDYAQAVEFLDRSISLSSFQLDTLLRLGYAAMQVENWDLAARTYRTYCSYEFDNFEAWNNLSNAYIKLGQKARAWKVLQEAAKCDYDNWKIWDNIMVVSTDCAHFEEVIRAYHRILDLKQKHLDLEVLRILVGAISKNAKDNDGQPSVRYREGALKLLGRLTSQVTSDGELWEIYSDLSCLEGPRVDDEEGDPVRRVDFKVCQYLQKACACMSQQTSWEKDLQKAKMLLAIGIKYSNACLVFSKEDPNQGRQLISSARLSLRGVISKVKQNQTAVDTGEIVQDLQDQFKELQHCVDELNAALESLKL